MPFHPVLSGQNAATRPNSRVGPAAGVVPALLAVALLMAACGGGSDASADAGNAQSNSAGVSTDSATVTTGSGSPTSSGGSSAVTADAVSAQVPALDLSTRAASLTAYQQYHLPARTVSLAWSGQVSSCAVGSNTALWRNSVLRQVNFMRAATGLPGTVTDDATKSAKALAAALMMQANQNLNHNPPTSWACYSAAGAEAAGNSNLARGTVLGSTTSAIDLYMADDQTPSLGHRRWILYPPQVSMGTGDTPQANALWVIGGSSSTASPLSIAPNGVAWPPRGWWPRTLLTATTAWSFGLADADFSSAVVSVRDGSGNALALTQWVADAGYGDNTLAFRPSSGSWPIGGTADQSFEVSISGVRRTGSAVPVAWRVSVYSPG